MNNRLSRKVDLLFFNVQTIWFAIAVTFINTSYFLISFNISSIVLESYEDEIEESILLPETTNQFSLSDLLDLDILDFDTQELTDRKKQDECVSKQRSEITET
jgi:hypothetical protein